MRFLGVDLPLRPRGVCLPLGIAHSGAETPTVPAGAWGSRRRGGRRAHQLPGEGVEPVPKNTPRSNPREPGMEMVTKMP